MATYGEGEPTDNAVSFIRFLKEESEVDYCSVDDDEEKKGDESVRDLSESFNSLEFAVFGLGNRQYEQFNATGKLVNTLLEKCGCSRIASIGIGDDDNDLEGDFESWKDKVLWPILKKRYGVEKFECIADTCQKLPECHYTVEFLDGPSTAKQEANHHAPLASKHYFTASECCVTEKRELRSPVDGGSTLHLEIDSTSMEYKTADNLAILPVNDDATIEKVAKALGYNPSTYFKLLPAKGHESKFAALFPTPCTVYECLARYCDLLGPPRRSELKLLAQYATDPICKKALIRLASKEGKAEYKEKVMDAKLGIVDIISKLCPSIEMPLEHFVSVCPRLQPRYYTISSSSSVYPKSIHATVSVLSEEKENGSTFKGVCSGYLSDMITDGKVRAFVRDSTFRLPTDVSTITHVINYMLII
jgi:NADPH-ferrihemoprotein reductase